jgi:hypothetical protein
MLVVRIALSIEVLGRALGSMTITIHPRRGLLLHHGLLLLRSNWGRVKLAHEVHKPLVVRTIA